MLKRSSSLAAVLFILSLVLLAAPAATAQTSTFVETWLRTDQAVRDLVVSRTWIWGPLATAYPTTETYAEAPDGERAVMYFDKARMEDNSYRFTGAPWHVTNGLLVVELMSGRMQTGDNTFEQRTPSGAYVAGDPVQTDGIWYELFGEARGQVPFNAGQTLTIRVERYGGSPSQPSYLGYIDDPDMAQYGVTAAEYVPQTNHRVASVFWAFINSSGTVWEGNGYVTDNLFENPYYATGYPITEAYWASVIVGGVAQDVLLQCFERRCLTYTPANASEWRVEMGNVGQHYYEWRYGHGIPGSETATAYMVALEDNGQSGIPVGCMDSLVEITIPLWPTETLEAEIAATLTMLLSYDDRDFGQSGLVNALYQNDATVDSVSVVAGVATVNLTGTIPSGGVCDDPRIVGQLEETVLAIDGIHEVVILLNGQPLFPA